MAVHEARPAHGRLPGCSSASSSAPMRQSTLSSSWLTWLTWGPCFSAEVSTEAKLRGRTSAALYAEIQKGATSHIHGGTYTAMAVPPWRQQASQYTRACVCFLGRQAHRRSRRPCTLHCKTAQLRSWWTTSATLCGDTMQVRLGTGSISRS